VGDSAGTLNVAKIKGVHMALRAGMLAADHYAECRDASGFDAAWRASDSARELRRIRNVRPGFRWGLWRGLMNAALETVTFGKLPWTLANHEDWTVMQMRERVDALPPDDYARELPPRDRLASVFFAATAHDENQPVHLKVADTDICVGRCVVEYGNPCTRF